MQNNFFIFRAATKHAAVILQSERKYDKIDFFQEKIPVAFDETFKIVKGNRKRLYDFLETVDEHKEYLHFAISDKAKKVFEDNNITGWSSFPIRIAECDKQYHVLCVIARVGPLFNVTPKTVLSYGREFDIKTWDGSDIVNPENTCLTLCSERVKEVIEQNKLTNAYFKLL
jgi:hypothetical protein